MEKPLCSAPFNSLMIDTNKGVKPCCNWSGQYLGNLNTSSISEIKNGPDLQRLKSQMRNHLWPDGCLGCKQREDQVGHGASVRTNVYNQVEATEDGRIIHFEFNSTNTCNLACAMCGPSYSTNWIALSRKHGWPMRTESNGKYPDDAAHPINLNLVSKFIDEIDFSHLEYLCLKGGEPFLNRENILLLEHFEKIGVLEKIKIDVTTNGTVINERLLELLGRARKVGFAVSVDGVGELNQYIRYGFGHESVSDTKNILENIKKLASLQNVYFINPAIAISAYNVFNLEQYRQWWIHSVYPLNPLVVSNGILFSHIVMYPEFLSPRVLTDSTRQMLVLQYDALNVPQTYERIIRFLKLSFAGDDLHRQFVQYTKKMDTSRPKTICEIVPGLIREIQEQTAVVHQESFISRMNDLNNQ